MKSIEQLEKIMQAMIGYINTEKKVFENKELFVRFLKNNFDNYMLYTNSFIPIYNRHSSLRISEKSNKPSKKIKLKEKENLFIEEEIIKNWTNFQTLHHTTTILGGEPGINSDTSPSDVMPEF